MYFCFTLFSYSPNFWRMCLSMFLFMTSFNLILPELNTFITELGGSGFKGLVIGLFTISAGISRPFSGKLADYIGRKKVMRIGLFVCLIVCLLYPFCYSVWLFLVLRFLHGFSAGFFPTGSTALITDTLPEKLRGSGMGLWGLFISLGIGVGNGLSSTIVDLFSLDGLFVCAGLFSIFSFILLYNVQETLPNPAAFKWNLLHIKKDEIIEPHVIPVAIVMFLSAICSGSIFVLSPDLATYLKFENKGWFFMVYVLSTLGVRLFTGRISDRIGRRETLLIGMILITISMILIGTAQTQTWFTCSAVAFGVATGISSPTIFAWTADLSPSHRRGIGAGTMFIALEFGILTGSLVTNLIYDNTPNTILNVFLFGSSMAFLTVLYLIWHIWKRESAT